MKFCIKFTIEIFRFPLSEQLIRLFRFPTSRYFPIFICLILSFNLCKPSEPFSKKIAGNSFYQDKSYPLNSINTKLILYIHLLDTVTSTGDENGSFWVDPNDRKLYQAQKMMGEVRGKPYEWKPENFIWTGERFVFGSRIHGFYELLIDGTSNKITDYGRGGELTYDGKKIFRFYHCGVDNKDNGIFLENLDGSDQKELVCLGNSLEKNKPFYRNYRLTRPNSYDSYYIVRKQMGRGKNLQNLSIGLYKPDPNGGMPNLIYPIDSKFVLKTLRNGTFRSDGKAILFSWTNDTMRLLDITTHPPKFIASKTYKEARQIMNKAKYLPDHRSWTLTSWSNKTNELALLLRDCNTLYKRKECAKDLIILDEKLANEKKIYRLPPHQFVRKMLWSPDDKWVAILMQDEKRCDQIILVNPSTGKEISMPFDRTHFIQKIIWIR